MSGAGAESSSGGVTPAGDIMKCEGGGLAVSCGAEVGHLLPAMFGPGGASRCIQHPLVEKRLLSPIEFTALAGKHMSWKQAIKLDGGKLLQSLLDTKALNVCSKDCKCKNCEASREQPTDLSYLVETIYRGQNPSWTRPGDTSPAARRSSGVKMAQKKKTPDAKASRKSAAKNKSLVNGQELHQDAEKSQDVANLALFALTGGVEPALPDEFCPSPDNSPGKPFEKPAAIAAAVAETPPRAQPPSGGEAGSSSSSCQQPAASPATASGKKRQQQQQDIRHFFTHPATGANGVPEGAPVTIVTKMGIKAKKGKRAVIPPAQVVENGATAAGGGGHVVNGDGSGIAAELLEKKSQQKRGQKIQKHESQQTTKSEQAENQKQQQKQKNELKQEQVQEQPKKLAQEKKQKQKQAHKQRNAELEKPKQKQPAATQEPPQQQGKKPIRPQEKQQKTAEAKSEQEKVAVHEVKQELLEEQQQQQQEQEQALQQQRKKSITPVKIRFEAGELQRIKSIDEDDIESFRQVGQVVPPSSVVDPDDGDLDDIPLLVIHPERVRAKRQQAQTEADAATTESQGAAAVPVPVKAIETASNGSKETKTKESTTVKLIVGDGAENNSIGSKRAASLNGSKSGSTDQEGKKLSVEQQQHAAGKAPGLVATNRKRAAAKEIWECGASVPAKRSKPETSAATRPVEAPAAKKKTKTPAPPSNALVKMEAEDKGETDGNKVGKVSGTVDQEKSTAIVTASQTKTTIKVEPITVADGSSGGAGGGGEPPQPARLPTYTHMIKQALSELNSVGGPGCTKLEILLYILQRFRPRESILHVTNTLFKVLEQGLKKGAFLSSASCTPRKLKQQPASTSGSNTTSSTTTTSTNGDAKKAAAKKLTFKVKEEPPPAASKERKKSTEAAADSTNGGKPQEKKKEIGVTPKRLLEPLASICRAKRLGRKAALKKVWCYIKAKKLLDPNDKSRILCDDKMRKLTKAKVISSKALCGCLKEFMVPIKS